MLSNSSLHQPHRQQPCRQNSLDVPRTLDLPGSPQRPTTLDLSTFSPTFGFGRLSTQDSPTSPGKPRQFTTTMQGAQLHSAAQPGYHTTNALDQRAQTQIAHLHMIQAMQEQASRQGVAPPEQAIRNIQNQIRTFYEAYPQYAQVAGMSPQSRPGSSGLNGNTSPMTMPVTTPVMMARATTPPQGFLPTPPPTQKTAAGRTVRHMDAGSMPMNFGGMPVVHIQHPATHDMPLFQDAMGAAEYVTYGSPSYAASVAGTLSPHMSPGKQELGMQTLFEDSPMMATPEMMAAQQQMMMAAAAAAGRGYYYPDSPMRVPMSPREAMLASLAVDASIEDTGISAEEVASFISPQDGADGKWTCMFPECGKKFGRKENIRSHVQTHLGDRQFKCNHCGKCFVRQHDLKRHAKIHSGDKPHRCPCGNGFARQDALTRHRQRGVCSGALPGFERREVKRGRPRKHRPELAERADKAQRARQMDARRGSADDGAYSSSSPSDSGDSDPYTPPHMADGYASAGGIETYVSAYNSDNTPPTSPLTSTGSRTTTTFQAGRTTFDVAAASSHGSPVSHHSPAGFASPHELQRSAHNSPVVAASKSQASVSPALSNGSVPAPAAAAEPSLGEQMFDWGAIESQPSLVADGFSPAAASSPAHTDLFGDELDLLDARHELFGSSGEDSGLLFGKNAEAGAQNGQGGVDSVFDLVGGDIEGWLLTH